MSIELKIKWEGSEGGLAEHRLSIGSFGLPLHYLLSAIRRRATNIVRDAMGKEAASVGRYASSAKRIDIEVQSLLRSSVGIQAVVRMQDPRVGGQFSLLDDLPKQATDKTLEAIDHESRGELRDESVRKYLESLPDFVTRQEYTLITDGNELRTVSFGQFTLPELVADLPHLIETEGKVIGVGFEPGRNLVRASVQSGDVTMKSDAETVNKALQKRDTDVRVLYVEQNGQRRLLRMDDPHQPRPQLDVDDFVFEKWRSVIKALAK